MQNSYYWGQVIGSPSKEGSLLSNEMFQGYTKQELHEALKEKFDVKDKRWCCMWYCDVLYCGKCVLEINEC